MDHNLTSTSAAVFDTPTSVTMRIKNALEPNFRAVLIEGEISGWKPSPAGHAYFNLKDETAVLPCAFFGIAARRLAFAPRDGVKVRALGDISVYAPRGNYQLVVRSLEPAGLGDLMMRLEELKRKLLAEGLFDAALKRPLPFLPRKIGIVTSPTGAVIRDILNVTLRRFPGLNAVIAPARVQGEGAEAEIIAGIRALNALVEPPDVLIVARGGGSIEDLWCFNSEALARAIRDSRIPVISAVGHETDTTICDFAADVRAPTPSAAAEIVTANKADLDAMLESFGKRVRVALIGALRQNRQRFDYASSRFGGALPKAVETASSRTALVASRLARGAEMMLRRPALRVQELENALTVKLRNSITSQRNRLENIGTRLAGSNPATVLERGYAIIRNRAGQTITQVAQVAPDEIITARLSDGEFDAQALGGEKTNRNPKKRTTQNGEPRNRKPQNGKQQNGKQQNEEPDLFSL